MGKLSQSSLALSFLLNAAMVQAQSAPQTPRVEVTETLHGMTVADPYRWMENWDDPRLPGWVEAQNEFTRTAVTGNLYDELAAHFTELLGDNKNRMIPPQRVQRLLQRHQMIPWQPEVPIITEQRLSPTGRYEIILRSDTSSDLKLLQIRDQQAEGALLDDFLLVKFAGNFLWDEGETGFFYYSDRDGRMGQVVNGIYFHKLGDPQGEDRLAFQAASYDSGIDLTKIADQWFLTEGREGRYSLYRLLDFTTGERELVAGPLLNLQTVGMRGNELLIKTLEDAPMGKVIAVDLETKSTTLVIPEGATYLDQVQLLGDHFYLTYIENTEHRIRKFDPANNTFAEIPAPGNGSVYLYEADNQLKVSFSSYDSPTGTWRYEPTRNLLVVDEPAPEPPFAIEKVKTRYTAHNGREVPIWLIKHADTELNQDTPVYLYGYGGFSINIMPSFWTTSQPFVSRGGVVAVVTLPGGLEYGEEWHRAGAMLNKRNVFDDFAAAGLALFSQGISQPEKLAIGGGSNGGLLVGATMNLYPNLFQVAVPEVGVMDMTRFELFTAGKWWADEYGYRSNPLHFAHLLSISPYHNLQRAVRYPATLVLTADLDDRVVPAHSWKYAARLQATVGKTGTPAFLHTKVGGSHSSYSGTLADKVQYHTTKWTFIMQHLGMK